MISKGDKLIHIELPSTLGELFSTRSLEGKRFMISFFRFATCTFCNVRLHRLIKCRKLFGKDFHIVIIFDSSMDNLLKRSNKTDSPYPILADENRTFYEKYTIQHSIFGVAKGVFTRVPTLLTGLKKGYIPFPIKGDFTTMPADFLVDENGIFQKVYYGKDEGDHLSIKEIIKFSNSK